MKAKLYVSKDKFEIRLSNDELIKPKKNEAKEKFIERVQKIVNTEHLDDTFELIEIDEKMVASNDDATLLSALDSAEGIQKELIQTVLNKRKAVAPRQKKVAAAPISIEEAKSSQAFKDAEANTGKYVSFSPAKSEEVYEGKIAGVALNKTNTIFYYTVVESTGRRRCCAVKNETIKFIDAPIEEAKPEKVKPAAKPKVAKTKAESAAVAEEFGYEAANDLM